MFNSTYSMHFPALSQESLMQWLWFAAVLHTCVLFNFLYINWAVSFSLLNGFTFVSWGLLYLTMRYRLALVKGRSVTKSC